jgi:hypothetical protein
MAKLIGFIVVLLFCGIDGVNAQSLYAVFGGGQATSAKYTVRDNKQETEHKFGGQGGIMIKIPFENQLYFAPAMYYSMKGYTVALKDSAFPPGVDAISNDVRIHSIDIAPLFQIDFSKQPGHLFVRFGPSVEAIIKGTEEVGLKNNTTVKRDMKFSFGDYGRVTASLVGQFGYETGNGFMIFAHYGHGIGSMNNADRGPRITHRVAGLSIGKYFGKSKH